MRSRPPRGVMNQIDDASANLSWIAKIEPEKKTIPVMNK